MAKILPWLHILLLLALTAGCAPAASASATLPAAESAAPMAAESAAPLAATSAPAPTLAAALAATPLADAPAAAATIAPARDPAGWREWPVVPAATATAVATYARGLALGNDPRAFSKVGDCQSIKEVLMGVYDQPGRYALSPENARLQETIDHFRGSFDRDGQAVQGGFNTASVLSPLWANPDACQAGENPLACELRVHRPSIVIISLEVWWNGRTPERYEQYMRRIIEFALEKGVVPVLSTKADNVEGDHAINLATARLAAEYDLPLWNWWRAAQELPNGGLDPTRPDGFHISKEAWSLRAATALMALDSVWRGVTAQDAPQPILAAAGPTPSPVASAALPVAAPRALHLPPGFDGFGQLELRLAARDAGALQPAGAWTLDFAAATLRPSAQGDAPAETSADAPAGAQGWRAQSPDGKWSVYRRVVSADASMLVLVSAAGKERDVQLPGTNVLDAAWSPDGTRLAVLSVNRSDYSGKWGRVNLVLFTPANFDIQVLPYTSGMNARVLWSPDGGSLLTTGTDLDGSQYRVNLRLVRIATKVVTDLSDQADLRSDVPLLVTGIAWKTP